jgi:putative endonuclease
MGASAGKPALIAKAARRSPKGEDGPSKIGPALVKYVYLLESVECPEETYVGLTDDLKSRLVAHNAGRSPHTAKFKPWRLVTCIAFSDERKATDFNDV